MNNEEIISRAAEANFIQAAANSYIRQREEFHVKQMMYEFRNGETTYDKCLQHVAAISELRKFTDDIKRDVDRGIKAQDKEIILNGR